MTPEHVMSVRNVRKQFASVTAVDDISFDVYGGEVFALLGPNGAGKTTLLRMLLDLLRPDAGTVRFHGASAAGGVLDPRQIGYLPEERGLYQDVSVLRTLTYFGVLRGMNRGAAQQSAQEWLARMQLRDRAREPLKSLSKGNQQKVQFISAVLHRPSFAVLDEPFSGLDPLNQDFFITLIGELRADGAAVLLSAHQMQLVERVADRILVLNRGQQVLHGSLPDVRRQWTTGRRLKLRVEGTPPADWLTRLATNTSAELHDGMLELFVPGDQPLSPLLAQIGACLDVRDIESHAITLHDVYVSAIERHNGATAEKRVS